MPKDLEAAVVAQIDADQMKPVNLVEITLDVGTLRYAVPENPSQEAAFFRYWPRSVCFEVLLKEGIHVFANNVDVLIVIGS